MNETEFIIFDKSAIDKEVHAIDHGAIVYSHSGNARVRINFEYWNLSSKDVLIFFPGDMVKWEVVDDDFSAYVIRYSSDILRSASMNVEHAVYDSLKSDRRCGYEYLINEVVDSMFRIFKFYFTVEHYSMTDRIVALQLQAFFWAFTIIFSPIHEKTFEVRALSAVMSCSINSWICWNMSTIRGMK